MAIETIRGVASVSFSGIYALECLSDYRRPTRLRLVDDLGADDGALSFAAWDLGSALEPGNGYLCHLFDEPGGTLLATGRAVQRGGRSSVQYTLASQPADGDTVTIAWPDLSDESAAITEISQVYTWRTATPVQFSAEVARGGSTTAALDALASAINGSATYGAAEVGPGTASAPELIATRTSASTLAIEARQGGTWGQRISVVASAAPGAPLSVTYATGGTGYNGLEVQFDGPALPNSLMLANSAARVVHLEIFGLDSANRPTKILTAPALLHASGTVLP